MTATRRTSGLSTTSLGVAAVAASIVLTTAGTASAEPAACLSPDPSKWPVSSKPYFMVAFDTSGSMVSAVNASNSCGYPNTRVGHGRCALRNTLLAFSGEVNFGLASFARQQTACSGACFSGCTYANLPNNSGIAGCGPRPGDATTRAGAFIRVPLLQDHYWLAPPDASNVPTLKSWVDDSCTGSTELFGDGNTPLNGILRDMYRYYSAGWTHPSGAPTYPSPLGTLAQGERPCRSVNVILITDGDETCDTQQDAVNAAAALYGGFTKDGIPWKVKTFVIGFAGAIKADTDGIAAAGGTVQSVLANNESELSSALAGIVAGAIKPEVCDNADNNCNGCTDEGYNHYCNVGQACCAWATAAQRTTCLSSYQASITPQLPSGNLALLPCTTPAQQALSASWLCYDPKETCDGADNNCVGGADEGVLKCGNPAHCPKAETCNGLDDDCNGVVDENVCNGCVPSPEVCDGCDNDCDGVADNGVVGVPCGLASPPNCVGTMACKAPQVVPVGTCAAGGGFAACSNSPAVEVCDGVDNDCDGVVDDGVAPVACVPAGTPGNLVYGGSSQCVKGTQACGGACQGFVGPSAEVCDGVDNDCDGVIDDGVPGTGVACGVATPPCKAGATACVAGVLTCQGSVGPQPEVCDGVDNNCNGQVDDAPLADAPAPGQAGCWAAAGNCCSFKNVSWCPPAGATCKDAGGLTAPCSAGLLSCAGAAGWACVGPKAPSPEACDGLDNDCDGKVDDAVPGVGAVCGTDVGACKAGVTTCAAGKLDCTGSAGPSVEICNGVDDDCNGLVDDAVPGTGAACGNATPPCAAGAVACVGGALVCQGGVGPKAEVCNGLDDDCDGVVDEGPLADAPPQPGCWTDPGNCCTFSGLSWCPPAGAACFDVGALTAPCSKGTLTCGGVKGWSCLGAKPPGAEVCDGVDNDCNGSKDDVAPVACVPAGTPGNLVYGGSSQCKLGAKTCGGCVGFVGPAVELCDGLDNDCNGQVDDAVGGLGKACGASQPPCQPGLTACVAGAISCVGGVGPGAEICDGIDNDCDGKVDEAPLADSPAPGLNGCWSEPGNCCQFQNLAWCPAPGATCNGPGQLAGPCHQGSLVCAGGKGWLCQGPKGPGPEICDGLDNDCNGGLDDGPLPDVGAACGIDQGACKQGKLACAGGALECQGATTPSQEICDGVDNDCNGTVDDGVPAGGPCTPAYDAAQYPGPRDKGSCSPGVSQCDGFGGLVCAGGTGPSPEVCDGIDNDCDGDVDELGPAPDGIDGSENPNAPPAGTIGAECGVAAGECSLGKWACDKGKLVCVGAVPAGPEQCDCKDNDCDGVVDNENPKDKAPLCSPGKQCVSGSGGCQCAGPCGAGEHPCPAGQRCEDVKASGSGKGLGFFCVQDFCPDQCSGALKKDAKGTILCAPAGAAPGVCPAPPPCVCKGAAGCDDPCAGVTCDQGLVCTRFGAKAGTCVQDNCWSSPCKACDDACYQGVCVHSPCGDKSCDPGQVCKPKPDFSGPVCSGSCAGVSCKQGERCRGGACVPSCDPECGAGFACDDAQKPPTCVPDKCDPKGCGDGSCCDPISGNCAQTCPCEGVVCPAGQACSRGECVGGGAGGSGGRGGSGAGGTPTTGSTGAGGGATTASFGAAVKPDERVWGNATGGGGCSCEVGAGASGGRSAGRIAAVVALAVAMLRRRRPRRSGGQEVAR